VLDQSHNTNAHLKCKTLWSILSLSCHWGIGGFTLKVCVGHSNETHQTGRHLFTPNIQSIYLIGDLQTSHWVYIDISVSRSLSYDRPSGVVAVHENQWSIFQWIQTTLYTRASITLFDSSKRGYGFEFAIILTKKLSPLFIIIIYIYNCMLLLLNFYI